MQKLKNKNKTKRAIKCHPEFAMTTIVPMINKRDKYKGFLVKRKELFTINFVVGFLKLIAVLFFLIIIKALIAIRPDAINIGIPVNKRIDHLLNTRLKGNSQ